MHTLKSNFWKQFSWIFAYMPKKFQNFFPKFAFHANLFPKFSPQLSKNSHFSPKMPKYVKKNMKNPKYVISLKNGKICEKICFTYLHKNPVPSNKPLCDLFLPFNTKGLSLNLDRTQNFPAFSSNFIASNPRNKSRSRGLPLFWLSVHQALVTFCSISQFYLSKLIRLSPFFRPCGGNEVFF